MFRVASLAQASHGPRVWGRVLTHSRSSPRTRSRVRPARNGRATRQSWREQGPARSLARDKERQTHPPISGMPKIGQLSVPKSGKPDLGAGRSVKPARRDYSRWFRGAPLHPTRRSGPGDYTSLSSSSSRRSSSREIGFSLTLTSSRRKSTTFSSKIGARIEARASGLRR
jgi:hypothetical protein